MTEIHSLGQRAVLAVDGPEAIDFLQRVVTADLAVVSAEQGVACGLLTPQGKLLADFLVFGSDTGVWIDIHKDALDTVMKPLTLYRMRAKAEITHRDDLAVLWSREAFDGALADPRGDDLGWRAIGAARDAAAASPGDALLAALETSLGQPAWGKDYEASDYFPTDVNLDLASGIGWKKGCFIGQEVVSRMKRRGTIRKRAVLVQFDGAPPPAGAPLTAGETTIGEITSAEEGFAVAVIRTDRLEKSDGDIRMLDRTAHIRLPAGLEAGA